MSRRAQGSSEHAAQNQQKLKALVKIEGNKSCADCKRNKHPRWASWNLGIFVCIRCSGIHRGMGTHISRVKSVDLDAWTDEQLHSMLRWGNAKANKYWEDKLAPGHIPSEAKIENFIRTKYESKRWVMEGGLPDPATLDAGEDETPLQEVPSAAPVQPALNHAPTRAQSSTISRPDKPVAAEVNLFGEDSFNVNPQSAKAAATSERSATKHPEQAIPRIPRPSESLLGFDFLGGTSTGPPPRPASTGPQQQINSNVQSRPDLKQSILSLYASNQRTTPPTAPQQPATGYHTESTVSGAFVSTPGSLNDAFSGLSFGASPAGHARSTSTMTNSFTKSPSGAPVQRAESTNAFNAHPNLISTGGNFFNQKAAVHPPSNVQGAPRLDSSQTNHASSGDSAEVLVNNSSSQGWASPPYVNSAQSSVAPQPLPAGNARFPYAEHNPTPSVFNLSSTNTVLRAKVNPSPAVGKSGLAVNPIDAWGSNSDIWRSGDMNTVASTTLPKSAATIATTTWGSSESIGGVSNNGRANPASTRKQTIHVAADEDFGGWESSNNVPSSAVPQPSSSFGGWESSSTTTHNIQPLKSNGEAAVKSRSAGTFGGAGDDLFSNVWE